MALKFVKALLSVKERDLVLEVLKSNLITSVINIIEESKERISNLSVLHSAAFELVNSYGTKVA